MSLHSRDTSSSAGDSLRIYLAEIRKYPLIGAAEEAELARRIQQGDGEALARLVCANLRFVISVARKYHHGTIPLADLINEGNLGLIRAAERFDHTRGVRFITYAVWWIRQAMLQASATHFDMIHVPASTTTERIRLNRRAGALRNDLGREPTRRELAGVLDVREEVIATALMNPSYQSLDAPLGDSADVSLQDLLADDEEILDAELQHRDLATTLDLALRELRGREAQVVRMHFGFDGREPMTLEAIAELFGITRERVRQIRDKAVGRLRKGTYARTLSAF